MASKKPDGGSKDSDKASHSQRVQYVIRTAIPSHQGENC